MKRLSAEREENLEVLFGGHNTPPLSLPMGFDPRVPSGMKVAVLKPAFEFEAKT